MDTLILLAMVCVLAGLASAAPIKGSRVIARSFGRRASLSFRAFNCALLALLVVGTVYGVWTATRDGAWTAATLTPFIMLFGAVPLFWITTLAWLLALIVWRRIRS